MTGKPFINETPKQADTGDEPVSAESAKSDSEPAKAPDKNILSEHKGKLAIGVAATLGLMVYYKWREKNLSKEDPEAYARLKRIKDSVRANDTNARQQAAEKQRDPASGK